MADGLGKERSLELIRAEHANGTGEFLRQLILGAQDGLVNVLGVLLGVAVATNDARIVIIAGLAATFAESISMGAVAYTSSKAAREYYDSELAREKREIKEKPEDEREEIRVIYRAKGFRGKLLEQIVDKITRNERTWLKVMMQEELGLTESGNLKPEREGAIVFVATLAGSLVPLLPFFVLSVGDGIAASVAVSLAALFAVGAYKGRVTTGAWLKSGAELAAIGGAAALAGYGIGALLGATL